MSHEAPNSFAAVMKNIPTNVLIEQMQRDLKDQISRTQEILGFPVLMLAQRPEPDRWSIVEIFEHMVLSSGHYLVRAERIYADPKCRVVHKEMYTPGRMGELFTEGLRPTPTGKVNWKMRTMGMFEPRPYNCQGVDPLERFVDLCERFLAILVTAKSRGLEGPKVTSTLGPILRFKVGDAIRFPIAHQQRHMLQIERTLQAVRAIS